MLVAPDFQLVAGYPGMLVAPDLQLAAEQLFGFTFEDDSEPPCTAAN